MTKKPLKVLVLTDHQKHSAENSIYALLRAMKEHPRCASIDIASRFVERNNAFFNDKKSEALHAIPVLPDFAFDPTGQVFETGIRQVNPKNYDVLFLRLPRPISDDFLLWLESLFSGIPIVNNPKGIIETSSKAFLLNFPEVCPPIDLCHSVEEVLSFASQFPIVLKPLREYGGKGLLKIDGDVLDDGDVLHETKTYLDSIAETLQQDGYLAMKFLKNVRQGDKRILVAGGETLAASLRLPAPDSWLCNIAQGGQSVSATVDADEERIIAAITPALTKAGILIYGADTLVDDQGKRVLSEINTLSIGGFPQAEIQTGRPIISLTIKKIIQYVDAFTQS